MSKLLISEQPLQVLPSLAKLIGLNDALFLQQLHYWLSTSKHEHDGKVWIYNTFEEWQKQFPFWSLDTMQRIAKRLAERDLIHVHRFNEHNWDQTNWYAINYDKLEEMSVNLGSRKLRSSDSAASGQPDTRKLRSSYQETTQENNNNTLFDSERFSSVFAEFEEYRKQRRQKLTPIGRQKLLAKLGPWGEARAIEALNRAMENGWQGVYEDEAKGNGKVHPNSAKSGRLIV